jgi:hypothetical protein
MSSAVYALCAATSLFCAVLLTRSYRARRDRVLLWLGLCFWGLVLNNLLLFTDYVVMPTVDLALIRGLVAAAALMVLLFGLIWDGV